MPRSLPLPMWALLLVCLLAPGCESDTRLDSAFTVRDSAGVEIVESNAPQLGPDAWTVSPERILQIGEAEGDEHYLFSYIPSEARSGMGGTLRLKDGRIVVCDGMAWTARIFDQEGKFVSQFGRDGAGPGEFERPIQTCTPHGEGIAVSEDNRVSYFDSEGWFLSRVTFPGSGVYLGGVFPDGSLLTRRVERESQVRMTYARTSGLYPLEAIVGAVRPDGTAEDWTILVHSSRRVRTKDNYIIAQPFAPMIRLAVWGEDFVYGWGDSYELQVFSREGALSQILRRDVDPAPVPVQDREWYADSLFQALHASEDARRFSEGLIFPDHFAAFDLLLVDHSSDLWVRRFDPNCSVGMESAECSRPSAWDVFDPSGRWLTTVTMPKGVVIHDIGEDYVLGVWKGEMGVPYVRMYALDRGSLQ